MPVDVDLDSPLIPLAGLYLVGQNSRGRRFTGGESGKGMLAAGFAASSANWAASEALSATGMSGTISNSLAQALLGAGVSRYGGSIPANRAMSRGIMYNVAGNAFSDLGADAGSLFGSFFGGNGGTESTQTVQSTKSSSSSGSTQTSTQPTRQRSNTVRF